MIWDFTFTGKWTDVLVLWLFQNRYTVAIQEIDFCQKQKEAIRRIMIQFIWLLIRRAVTNSITNSILLFASLPTLKYGSVCDQICELCERNISQLRLIAYRLSLGHWLIGSQRIIISDADFMDSSVKSIIHKNFSLIMLKSNISGDDT